jgi:hypothetical protein
VVRGCRPKKVLGEIRLSSLEPRLVPLVWFVVCVALRATHIIPRQQYCRPGVRDGADHGRLAASICSQLVRELRPYSFHLMRVSDSVRESV